MGAGFSRPLGGLKAAPTSAGDAVLECVILVGLPGAGKSTLYAQRFADTHELVSMDLHRKAGKKSLRIETHLRQ